MEMAMQMKLSEAGGAFNEDRAGFISRAAWVLDGSGPLTERRFTPEKNDVHWFVGTWDRFLRHSLAQKDMREALHQGMGFLRGKFSRYADGASVSRLDLPSAAIAAVKVHQGILEYFVLGDCTLILREKNGNLHYFKDDRVEPFDRKAAERICADRSICPMESSGNGAFSEEALEILRHNRLLKNTEEGYPILEFDFEALKKGFYGRMPVEKGSEAILMTDGFSSLIDRYKKYTPSELLLQIKERGLEELYAELRSIESTDRDMAHYPRLKRHDDASIIYMKV